MRLPPVTIPEHIRNNPKFYPFFKDCLGAFDGTHIPASVNQGSCRAFRNSKGYLSQNVLGVVNFEMEYVYVLPGWEGSAHDGCVLQDALTKGFLVPDGKFYLGDAAYQLTSWCLTPYRGVCYHLNERGKAAESHRILKSFLNCVIPSSAMSLKECMESTKSGSHFDSNAIV